MVGYSSIVNVNEATVNKVENDSNYVRLQKYIDSIYLGISQYDSLIYQGIQLRDGIAAYKESRQETDSNLAMLNNYSLSTICAEMASKKNESKLKEDLKARIRDIFDEEEKLDILLNSTDSMEGLLKQVETRIISDEKKFIEKKKILIDLSNAIDEPGKLIVKGAEYRFYIAQLNLDKVVVHNNPNPGRGQTLRDVKTRLEKQNEQVLMVVNGGMYTPAFGAQGLLVENKKQVNKLDTLKPNNDLNFYMQPNGVFLVDSTGFNIVRTDDYKLKYLKANKLPQFATQSGPMLIADNFKNKKFRQGSKNFYIRNGIGIINNRKIVFIIADTPVNFYEFSSVFENVFGCKTALYLDGAISEMFIDEKLSGFKNLRESGRTFGPVISITRQKN